MGSTKIQNKCDSMREVSASQHWQVVILVTNTPQLPIMQVDINFTDQQFSFLKIFNAIQFAS